MTEILQYMPGMQATIYLETLNADGYRADGYPSPAIDRIIFPGFTLASGYPTDMSKLDTGLYYYQFLLPQGATSVGTYLVDVSYENPANSNINFKTYQIIVTAPFGNYSATSF